MDIFVIFKAQSTDFKSVGFDVHDRFLGLLGQCGQDIGVNIVFFVYPFYSFLAIGNRMVTKKLGKVT